MIPDSLPFKVVIRKDGMTPSRPWTADVVFPDGMVWKSWMHSYRTKTALVREVNAAIAGTSYRGKVA